MTTTALPTVRPAPPWACPGSRTVQRADASRADWLDARRLGVGGSDFPILLGLTPPRWGSPYRLWQDKTGQLAPERTGAWLDRGRDLEPIVLAKFSAATGLATRRTGLQRCRACPRLQFSPDALAEDGALVEAKLLTRYGQDRWADGLPGMYEWQVRYGLAVTGKTRGYLAALDADSWELDIHEITAEPGDLEFCAQVVADFWAHVSDGTPPPIQPHSLSTAELLHRHPRVIDPGRVAQALLPEQARADITRYAQLTAIESAARAVKAEKEQLKLRLAMQIGDAEYLAVDGVPLLRWKDVGASRFRQREFTLEHPELAAAYTDTSRTRRLELLTPTKGPLT